MHGVDELSEPRLERVALLSVFTANPESKLRDHDGARVAVILRCFEPCDHAGVAALLGRLAKHVGIEQPTHSLRRFGRSRLRRGKSSMRTGHDFNTPSQSASFAIRRNVIVSSSASNSALKWSPGVAGARLAGAGAHPDRG